MHYLLLVLLLLFIRSIIFYFFNMKSFYFLRDLQFQHLKREKKHTTII